MTDLEKRAELYADTKYIHGTSEWIKIKQSYLDSTKSETALLSKHVLDLQKTNGALTDRVNELENRKNGIYKFKTTCLQKSVDDMEKNLTKAKEIISECLPALKRGSWWELHDKAEQFLNSEVEK